MIQTIVLFIEPNEVKYFTPLKIGNLFMNRFAIDEDLSVEIFKVYVLGTDSDRIRIRSKTLKALRKFQKKFPEYAHERKLKGMNSRNMEILSAMSLYGYTVSN